MSQDIGGFVPRSCEVLALGEPTHREPAFGVVRNEIFRQLAELGFRSIAVESDRVAALVVNDYVVHGVGSLDGVMREGFSHGFGGVAANRELVEWMREYNEARSLPERLTFHGFDAATENTSAPSPRGYLEYAQAYLGVDGLDIGAVAGDDHCWSRAEAILDYRQSMGMTEAAEGLRRIGEDLLTRLFAGAPRLIAATSREDWVRAKVHLEAGLALLHYHWQAAQPGTQSERIGLLMATRDTIMARNLLDIRGIEAERGATLVFAHNLHLRRDQSMWAGDGRSAAWFSAGAIVNALRPSAYCFIASSLGRSEALSLSAPAPGTFEAFLQSRTEGWSLTVATELPPSCSRVDTMPQQGYFPLDEATVKAADVILHVNG